MSSNRMSSSPDPSGPLSSYGPLGGEGDAVAGVPTIVLHQPPQHRRRDELPVLVAEGRFRHVWTQNLRDTVDQARPQLVVWMAVRRHRRLVVEESDEGAVGGEHDCPLVPAAIAHQRRLVRAPVRGVGVVGVPAVDGALEHCQRLAALPQQVDVRKFGGDVVNGHRVTLVRRQRRGVGGEGPGEERQAVADQRLQRHSGETVVSPRTTDNSTSAPAAVNAAASSSLCPTGTTRSWSPWISSMGGAWSVT